MIAETSSELQARFVSFTIFPASIVNLRKNVQITSQEIKLTIYRKGECFMMTEHIFLEVANMGHS